MYSNLAKSPGIPLLSRTHPRCWKSSPSSCFRSFSNGFCLEAFKSGSGCNSSSGRCREAIGCVYLSTPGSGSGRSSSTGVRARGFSSGSHQKPLESIGGMRTRVLPTGFRWKTLEKNISVRPRNFAGGVGAAVKRRIVSNGCQLRSLGSICGSGDRFFSSGSEQRALKDSDGTTAVSTLPWIAGYKGREEKGVEKRTAVTANRSLWEKSAESYFSTNGGKLPQETREIRDISVENLRVRDGSSSKAEEEEEEEEEDAEPIDDPRWDRIKNKYKGSIQRESRFEKPEVHRWNNQENWGRKTWKEATNSSVPKMVGQGVYGVGPVLAALNAQRREFYALYVQEGLALSGSNRKKKDKKGVEKVLQLAEKIGLKVIEASKHDLNMVVDNRPHQGLVLDASPLEMVNIRELERVSTESQRAPLWVALDEVTDPQNLGAIIRSSYFFGAEGVVLCAKNSAPLSGVVSKASAGSLELIELLSCKNMMQFLSSSAENGWRVLGGSVSPKAIPLSEVEAGEPTILVLGSEGSGLRPLVERSCTQLIRIPGNNLEDGHAGGTEAGSSESDQSHSGQELKSFLAVESLNVSVAAGVLLYHLVGHNIRHAHEKPTNAFV